MKISGVRIRTKKKDSYRHRQWAHVLSVKTSEGSNETIKCIYPDGEVVHIPLSDNENYEIARG